MRRCRFEREGVRGREVEVVPTASDLAVDDSQVGSAQDSMPAGIDTWALSDLSLNIYISLPLSSSSAVFRVHLSLGGRGMAL